MPKSTLQEVVLVSRKLCRAASCRSSRNGGVGESAGSSLCTACGERLANDLLNLPALYSDCNRDTGSKVVHVIRKVPRKGGTTELMNPAAADARSAILAVLASWAGLVADERRLRPPGRNLEELTRFLHRHVDWLTRHPAAPEMANEIQDLTRTARNIAYPSSARQVYLGCCPEGDCAGDLFALMRPCSDPLPAEIVCSLSPDHSWPITWWTKLARQIAAGPAKQR
jgi:hypothetical protein